MKPTESLRAAAEIYEQRNKLYGDNYKTFGPWVALLFPDGITLVTPNDFNRFGVITQMLGKLSRYAANFKKGGHDDSLDDLAVYAMMLKELDIDCRPTEHKIELAPGWGKEEFVDHFGSET
jgi:hypothetical protein